MKFVFVFIYLKIAVTFSIYKFCEPQSLKCITVVRFMPSIHKLANAINFQSFLKRKKMKKWIRRNWLLFSEICWKLSQLVISNYRFRYQYQYRSNVKWPDVSNLDSVSFLKPFGKVFDSGQLDIFWYWPTFLFTLMLTTAMKCTALKLNKKIVYINHGIVFFYKKSQK